MMIRAISLWQVWASAMSRGLKKIETRDNIPMWRTAYRGPVAIHAAKKPFKPSEYEDSFIDVCRSYRLLEPDALIYGAVLCIVDLVDVLNTETVADGMSFLERTFGNYSENRLALVTDKLRVLPEPHYCKGHQGWFGWTVPRQYENLITQSEFTLR